MSSAVRQLLDSRSSLRKRSLVKPELKKPGYDLEKISGEIAWYEEQARNSARLTLQYKLEIGKRLVRAKELLPHGQFLPWAQQQFGWTPRHVQNHLILAENAKRVSHLPAGASLRLALASIRKADAAPVSCGKTLEVVKTVQRLHLIGEIREGALDAERFLIELERLAAQFGAPDSKWKARWEISKDPSGA